MKKIDLGNIIKEELRIIYNANKEYFDSKLIEYLVENANDYVDEKLDIFKKNDIDVNYELGIYNRNYFNFVNDRDNYYDDDEEKTEVRENILDAIKECERDFGLSENLTQLIVQYKTTPTDEKWHVIVHTFAKEELFSQYDYIENMDEEEMFNELWEQYAYALDDNYYIDEENKLYEMKRVK